MDKTEKDLPAQATSEQDTQDSFRKKAEGLVGEMRSDLESVNNNLEATGKGLAGLRRKLDQMQEDLNQMFRLPSTSEESSTPVVSSEDSGEETSTP